MKSRKPEALRSTGHGRAAVPELPALTALRGLAAVAVLLSHSNLAAFNFAGGAPLGIRYRGYLAVDLFFFLSGFVLTHVYGSRLAEERSWRAIGKFLWARFCRIYPASLFTTAVLALALTVGKMQFPTAVSFKVQLSANLLLMQVPWLDTVVINAPSWSISAELYAYLLFPFIAPMISRLRRCWAVVLGVVLLIEIGAFHTILDSQISGWGALTRALPEFTAGVFAYRLYREQLFPTIWEKDATFVSIIALIIAFCFADVTDGVIVLLLLALLLAAVSNSGRMRRVVNARPLRWLGEVSYSVYIFQMFAFLLMASLSGVLVSHGLGGVRYEAMAVLLAIFSGVLVHRCVDLPVRAALRRLPDRVRASGTVFEELNRPRLPGAGSATRLDQHLP